MLTIRLLSGLFEPIMPSWSAKVYYILGFKRGEKEQELFKRIRDGGSWECLVEMVNQGNLEEEMNLPVPLFKRSKGFLYIYCFSLCLWSKENYLSEAPLYIFIYCFFFVVVE